MPCQESARTQGIIFIMQESYFALQTKLQWKVYISTFVFVEIYLGVWNLFDFHGCSSTVHKSYVIVPSKYQL